MDLTQVGHVQGKCFTYSTIALACGFCFEVARWMRLARREAGGSKLTFPSPGFSHSVSYGLPVCLVYSWW